MKALDFVVRWEEAQTSHVVRHLVDIQSLLNLFADQRKNSKLKFSEISNRKLISDHSAIDWVVVAQHQHVKIQILHELKEKSKFSTREQVAIWFQSHATFFEVIKQRSEKRTKRKVDIEWNSQSIFGLATEYWCSTWRATGICCLWWTRVAEWRPLLNSLFRHNVPPCPSFWKGCRRGAARSCKCFCRSRTRKTLSGRRDRTMCLHAASEKMRKWGRLDEKWPR